MSATWRAPQQAAPCQHRSCARRAAIGLSCAIGATAAIGAVLAWPSIPAVATVAVLATAAIAITARTCRPSADDILALADATREPATQITVPGRIPDWMIEEYGSE